MNHLDFDTVTPVDALRDEIADLLIERRAFRDEPTGTDPHHHRDRSDAEAIAIIIMDEIAELRAERDTAVKQATEWKTVAADTEKALAAAEDRAEHAETELTRMGDTAAYHTQLRATAEAVHLELCALAEQLAPPTVDEHADRAIDIVNPGRPSMLGALLRRSR